MVWCALVFGLLLGGCAAPSVNVCRAALPHRLTGAQVFDGPPEELASLVPDEGADDSGTWNLGYVFEHGRDVWVRCFYGQTVHEDVRVPGPVATCTYQSTKAGEVSMSCHSADPKATRAR